MKKPLSPLINRGFLSIEVSITLVIIMLAIMYGYPRYSRYIQEMEWNVSAGHMTIVNSAAKSYIHDNRHQWGNDLANMPGIKQITKSIKNLIDAGYLPKGFSEYNTAKQTYQVVMTLDPHEEDDPETKRKLVAFVLTQGGQEMPYTQLRYISQKVEGAGGYTQKTEKDGKDTVIATGAFGGWEFELEKDYNIQAKEGHLITWLSSGVLGTDTQDDDRLYRVEVKGHLELNTMKTDLNMGNKDINAAGTINAKEGNFKDDNPHNDQDSITATHNITSKQGWLITQGNKGWKNNKYDGGFHMKKAENGQWIIESINGKSISTTGQFHGETVQTDNNMKIDGYLALQGTAERDTACQPSGQQATDASGSLLSCVNGQWGSAFNIETLVIYGNEVPHDDWSYATCPYGTILLSGGFKVTHFSEDAETSYAALESYPEGNTWKVKSDSYMNTPPNQDVRMQAMALCVF